MVCFSNRKHFRKWLLPAVILQYTNLVSMSDKKSVIVNVIPVHVFKEAGID